MGCIKPVNKIVNSNYKKMYNKTELRLAVRQQYHIDCIYIALLVQDRGTPDKAIDDIR